MTRTEDIPRVFKEAFHIASTGRPGPVIVDVPKDLQNNKIVPPDYVKTATTASKHGPDYGFLWWLNTTGKWQGAPTSAFDASCTR